MCFCTPTIRTPFCDNCNQAMFIRINELKQQRDELQRDAERLNWIESNPRHAQIVIDGKITDCVFYGISCAELVRLRDAIDAAITQMKE